MLTRQWCRALRNFDRFPDDDDATSPARASTCDDFGTIPIERWVGEVRVGIEKLGHKTATAAMSRRLVRLGSANRGTLS